MNKLCALVDLLQREMRKPPFSNDSDNSNVSLDQLLNLKRFYEINSLCALETYHQLQMLGFPSIGIVILKIFQSFKLQITDLIKFNIKLFKLKGIHFETDILEENDKNTNANLADLPKKRQSKF